MDNLPACGQLQLVDLPFAKSDGLLAHSVLMTQTTELDLSTISGPFRAAEAISEGWLTRRQLYSPLFRQLFHQVHVPAAIPVTHELRCRAAALIAPPDAVLTGASAAAVHGHVLLQPYDPVEFVVPERARFTSIRGMNIRRTTIRRIDSRPWEGIRLATPLRLTMDLLTNSRLRKSLPATVGLLDALLRAGLVEEDELRSLLHLRHDHGIVRARQALQLADPLAESIPESELRVWLVTSGLEPTPQLLVYDDSGRFLGRLDLAFAEYKLAVEYDGEWHNDPAQTLADERRRAAFRAAGWEFIVVTKSQLGADPRALVAQVKETIRRRAPRD